jgi:hypothetical protein
MDLKYRQVTIVACVYHGVENASFIKYWIIAD